ncbi:hypothetical protein MED193_16914 [Roseobacter sp. MED193]|nr:hypothetical protein MED193_16914 [Roseobacter sp. MED193]
MKGNGPVDLGRLRFCPWFHRFVSGTLKICSHPWVHYESKSNIDTPDDLPQRWRNTFRGLLGDTKQVQFSDHSQRWVERNVGHIR